MGNHQEISSFIWRVCDDELRGLFKPHEYGDIILPFVVLRRLDCLIEPHKDEVVKQYNELLQSGIDDPKGISSEGGWEWKSGTKGTLYRIYFDEKSDIDYTMFLINQKYKNVTT